VSPPGTLPPGGRDTGVVGSRPPRRLLTTEIWLVLGVSLGASALFSLIHYVGDLTAHGALRQQVAELNGSDAPGRPWLDLTLQVASLVTSVVPVFLALHLLGRSGDGAAAIGLDRRRPRRDALTGAALAAAVGGIGLAFYLVAWHSGANLTVVPEDLPDVWWRDPVLVLSALQNGLVEEVVVVGYLLLRLRQLGWSDNRALLASATLRGSYHLYQGLGGFAGNALMGLLFGRLYQRWGRVTPLVIAHTLIDSVAFVGYAALRGRVSWLPAPTG
jgi:membrane protease YdiL (CAAX protease family)